MKKIISISLLLIVLISTTGCGKVCESKNCNKKATVKMTVFGKDKWYCQDCIDGLYGAINNALNASFRR